MLTHPAARLGLLRVSRYDGSARGGIHQSSLGVRMLLLPICIMSFAESTRAQEVPVSSQAMQETVDLLHQELVQIRHRLEDMRKVSPLQRPVQPGGDDPGVIAGKSPLVQLNRLRQDVADIALILSRAGKKPGVAPAQAQVRKVTASGETYGIHTNGSVRNREVEIRNVGTDEVANPRLVVNGRKNWWDSDLVLAEALGMAGNDRDRALAIWQFLKDNRYRDVPAHIDIELHDPVRYLNVYGYGTCDDAATNFMVLAKKTGIPARVWNLEGHVVPEAFFDGGWHMLDPDGEIYYLDDDGRTISSVETLARRSDIVRKYPSPVPYYTKDVDLAQVYATKENNSVSAWYEEKSEARHTMGYVLRPGESIVRSWANWGLYFSSRYLSEPAHYGNGRFTFEPVFKGGGLPQGGRGYTECPRGACGREVVPDDAGRRRNSYPRLPVSQSLPFSCRCSTDCRRDRRRAY